MLPVWLALATSVSSPECERALSYLFTIEREADRRGLDEAHAWAMTAFDETARHCPDAVKRAWQTPAPPNWDGLEDWEWLASVDLGDYALRRLRHPDDDVDDAWAWLAIDPEHCPNQPLCGELRALREENWVKLSGSRDPFLRVVAQLGLQNLDAARKEAATMSPRLRRPPFPPLYASSLKLHAALNNKEDADFAWRTPFEQLLRFTRRRYCTR